jgi:hypothetical protein
MSNVCCYGILCEFDASIISIFYFAVFFLFATYRLLCVKSVSKGNVLKKEKKICTVPSCRGLPIHENITY